MEQLSCGSRACPDVRASLPKRKMLETHFLLHGWRLSVFVSGLSVLNHSESASALQTERRTKQALMAGVWKGGMKGGGTCDNAFLRRALSMFSRLLSRRF